MCKRLCLLLALAMALSLGTAHGAADPDIIGWWWFDEGGGTTAADSSGNGNNGTLLGGASWAPGYFRTALQLDGVDGYVEVPHDPSLNVDDEATVMAWINTPRRETPGQGYQGVIGKGNGTARSYSLYTTPNNLHFSTGPSGAYIGSSSSTGAIPINEWVHVCGMIIDNGHQYYVNGEDAGRFANGAVGPGAADTENLVIGRTQEGTGRSFEGLIDDVRIYRRGLTQEEVQRIMTGSDLTSTTAGNPVPGDGQEDVRRDAVLTWTPGEYAATHDVYFGTVADDVNNASRANPMGVLVSQGQAASTYDPPGLLDIGQTYYWRIDEVNAPPSSTIFKGSLWSFTAEPLAYPIAGVIATSNGTSDATAGPEKTVDGSGLNANDEHSTAASDMWLARPGDEPLYIQYEFDGVHKLHEMLVWNYNVQFELLLGFGVKNVTIEYSTDGEDWAALGDFELTQGIARATYAANTTIPFQGVAARYVRLLVNSGYSAMGQYGLSEVRFTYIPAQAREPQPADGTVAVAVGSTLNWRGGRDATSHDVYLGSDPDELVLIGSAPAATFVPAELVFGTTYYWRIDAVGDEVWAGNLWSFSTQEYAWIDGFETYTDDIDAGEAIFDTWLDGWVNNTGSTVGHLQTPFAERGIVHSGSQSMPLHYDNATSPFYSEAERVFASPQSWTGNGADTLVLYVRGNAPAFQEMADGQILMSAIGTDIWDSADQFRYAYKSLSGNGSIVVRVDSLVRSDGWAKAGVMIRETLEPGSKHAFVAVTPDNGVSFQRRPVAGTTSYNTDVAGIVAPHWVKLTRTGNVFTAQQSADGVTWVDITPTAPVEITMAANVFIGLALTSHNASVSTAAEFSNLTTTGNVTGAWQTAGIGATQPEGNSAQPMYVRIEDSTGTAATVVNADATITLRPTWQEWKIPYADLAGVNLGRVQKMFIGVGSKTSPTAGGTGTVYVDDVGFGRPATAD
ncbi:LamG-like jellyroll fold domain-containing protein [Anaerobaca lacustris]|uniref:Discoidin domain-containing protein n=1 Tax=Anaerobaca lacustris TaxID=3044600 RepID=A0AAW6U7Y4_9BACT|nr:discoidin domain-containing protein [Sedimentisphaerales bacterium M17dextr]